MQGWEIGLVAAALPVALVISASIVIYIICYRRRKKANPQAAVEKTRNNYYGGLRMLRESGNRVASLSYSYSHHYPLQGFNWRDHPSLVSEAVEHGWVSFGFTKTCVAASSPTNFWEVYNRFSNKAGAGVGVGVGVDPEMSWEVGSGVEYVQKIRLNPGLPTRKRGNWVPPVQSVQTALPLPGPSLGDLSFPQEAYFEMTILSGEEKVLSSSKRFEEDEDIQLISQPANSEDHVPHISSPEVTPTNLNGNPRGDIGRKSHRSSSRDTHVKFNSVDPAGMPKVMSLGLAVGGSALYRLPGSDPGSVGFHSTGFVFLNGIAHVFDQEQHKPASPPRYWGSVNTVIGCGFDPTNRRVFFTLNGEQVYTLICNTDDFKHPLYPTIAANYDVTVLANFGQNKFQYLPANEERVANPCFRRPLLSSPVKMSSKYIHEDSGDLFSMGRIDSHWLVNIEASNSQNPEHRYLPFETESELFEIPLDTNNK